MTAAFYQCFCRECIFLTHHVVLVEQRGHIQGRSVGIIQQLQVSGLSLAHHPGEQVGGLCLVQHGWGMSICSAVSSPARAKNGRAPVTHCLRMRLISPIWVSNGASSPPLTLVVPPNTRETPQPVKGLWKLLAVLLDGRTWLGVLLIKYYILQSQWEG